MVYLQSCHFFDCFGCATGSGHFVGSVELGLIAADNLVGSVAAASGESDPGITRDAYGSCPGAVGRKVEQNRRVRARVGIDDRIAVLGIARTRA